MNFDLLVNALKGQFNTLNILLIIIILGFVLRGAHKRKASLIVFSFSALYFLVFSTSYLPAYLIGRIESHYQPFDHTRFANKSDQIFIHVLGGGYIADARLPEPGQLSHVSMGRLVEGIRIAKLFDNSILIVSGNVASGDSSMAWVARQSAIALGCDPSRIEMLSNPATTREEAKAFADHYKEIGDVIVVTDAIHMPRAMQFFEELGVRAHAAPANFLIKHDNNPFSLRWVPSVENFVLMDRVLREFFGSLKAIMF
jgi:uncharacterized SAM-binding protein YcdF (DUF218 family)